MRAISRGALAGVVAMLSAACLLAGKEAVAATQSAFGIPSLDGAVQLPVTLLKPVGDGPFPALVIAHDCSGLGPRGSGGPLRWSRELVEQGYVVLIPDSFTPRGFSDGVCTVPGRDAVAVGSTARAADAYAALAALRALSYVDGRRVGLMGASHGGGTTLSAVSAPSDGGDAVVKAPQDGFAAAIALYPSCAGRMGSWRTQRQSRNGGPVVAYAGVYRPLAPVLILIGEKDDWTPAGHCVKLVETGRAAGSAANMLDIKVYPDALHSFDNGNPVRYSAQRNNPNSPTGRGATTGGNAEAWADARRQVETFFKRHLKEVH